MIVIKVQYTVSENYTETNKENIKRVMNELRSLNNDSIKYIAYTNEAAKNSFMHFATYPNQETLNTVTSTVSFIKFKTELMASNPTSKPVTELFEIVDGI